LSGSIGRLRGGGVGHGSSLREMKKMARAWRRGAPKRVQSNKTVYFSSLALKRRESLGTHHTI